MVSAADTLRRARTEAGLSARELSRRSGVAESRISDYEHGRHQPSVAMLQRLLDATGHELLALPRVRVIDPERNGRVFADVLSLVDAIPFGDLRKQSRGTRPEPPRWSDLVGGAGRR